MIPGFEPGRWGELCTEFEALVELEPGAREARLAAIAATDPVARDALERLLDADASPSSSLDRIDAIFGVTDPRAAAPAGPAADVLGLVGRTVAHFEIVEPLAAGGMGIVYRAVDTHIGRPVALKFLRPEQHLDAPARERFLREARAAGALDHPNICSIYQAGALEDGRLFLAMPLYEGETLAARIAHTGPLPLAEALDFAIQLTQGLHAAHRAGIVHRDLKPANAVILPDGGLRILDFGIARVGEPAPTMRHDRLGTVAYMAPEQLRGDPIDARTDLWALGVVLHEMLTGQRPFAGRHEIAVAQAILHSVPVPPSALRAEVPAELDVLVGRLLARDPAERLASADAVRTALAAVASGLSPAPPSRAGRPTLAWGLAAGLLAAAVGIGAWQLRPDAPAPATPPRIVAVLPFEHDPDMTDVMHLATAIPAEIAAQLSRLQSAALPERSSVLPFAGTDQPLAAVASALEADAVVRGRLLQRDGEVRLTVEVHDARRPGRSWTREYDGADSTLAGLPGRAAAAIAAAVGLGPSAARRELAAHHPTASAEAWGLYLRGRALQLGAMAGAFGAPPIEVLQQAQALYARARELDPEFAMARARLAAILLALPPSDQTAARRDQARIEAETALRLHPGLPEAHEALATYWLLQGDIAQAVAALEQALAGRPHAPELLGRLGESLPRLGRWDEAVSALERASQVDPRNRFTHLRAALTHSRLRQYDKALRHWDRVIALGPEGDAFPRIIRGYVFLRRGDVESFDQAIREVPLGPDAGGMTTYAHWTAHRIRGRHAEALAVLDSARFALSADDFIYLPVPLMRAQTLERTGDLRGARENYTRARAVLAESLAAHPREPRIRVALALALAGLGRHDEAVREARVTNDLIPPVAGESMAATAFRGALVEVYLRAGALDAAFELLELLLSMPAGREISIPLLRVDPVYEPLRSDPRYAALLARHAAAPMPQ